jgi:UDP-glucuronate 4-epimerase
MAIQCVITGAAGFIGSTLAQHLAGLGHVVHACDWADPTGCTPIDLDPTGTKERLRADRMRILSQTPGIHLSRLDLAQPGAFAEWLARIEPSVVIHLAAQAGVRHSMQAPMDFVAPNLIGFANVLHSCHVQRVPRLLYASSSSVYGMRDSAPFLEDDRTDRPQSFYAATKQANEAMAYAYHAQYGLNSLGMRFFTVYGPWGRPDMAPYLFAQAIRRQQPMHVFAEGQLLRDFTYVGDTVTAVAALAAPDARWEGATVVNVGHNRPVTVNSFIQTLSQQLGTAPIVKYAPMQKADVRLTCASEDRLLGMICQWPDTPLDKGLGQFVAWLQAWDPEAACT